MPTEVVDEEGKAARVDLAMEREDVWVGRNSGMEHGFTNLVGFLFSDFSVYPPFFGCHRSEHRLRSCPYSRGP